ncbi:MAG: type II toxin-antitoxin system PemK/MazF family toxin [Propionibacteriaceae bacterium]|nr:type II toxin-antitoxin system PemK/MazF family toxin [Propionibacteriaceae bacterium]
MMKWLSDTMRRIGRDLLHSFLKGADQGVAKPRTRRRRSTTNTTSSGRTTSHPYPGDFQGTPRITYRPSRDSDADPGEIVWTWVPYEEDHSKGKDRPVLIIGRDGKWLLGLQLTSKDHDRDARQEARYGRRWMDIGKGPWDEQNRPSEVRINRIIRVDPTRVRRIGAVLDKERFTRVAEAVRAS